MSCPICSAPTEHAYRPFCSRRCANLDLGNWLNESYAIPSDAPEDDEDPPSPEASRQSPGNTRRH